MSKLFMLLVGCLPKGRHIEQHDVFFGIGKNIRDILPDVAAFWPEAKGSLHIDAWREVTMVDGFAITVGNKLLKPNSKQLFFINLGGYKQGEFEEFHYKMLVVAKNKNEAIMQSKQTAFFKHTGFKGATAHIDDKYGIAVDDLFLVKEILPLSVKANFYVHIEPAVLQKADELHLGYFRFATVDKWAPL